MIQSRAVFGLIFLLTAGLMAGAMFFEYVMNLEPCALCLAQRVMVVGIGLVCLLVWLINPAGKGLRFGALSALLFALGGVALAGRQLWLQGLPADQVPACGPGIYYMMDVFPLMEVIKTMLMGSGNCAEVQWQDPVLGLSIPGWTMVFFVFMSAVFLWQMFRRSASA